MIILLKYIFVGLCGSGLLIIISKGIVGPLFQRHEDYYKKTCAKGGGECD